MERAYAGSVISNYRRMMKDERKKDASVLSDDEIFACIEAVGVASTGDEQDEWTLDAMEECMEGRRI